MQWNGNSLIVEAPKRPKRLTGTRFPAALGLDRWNSPFKVWCALTRTYEEPFEDTKYTIAGKVIEPKVIDYLNKTYFFNELVSPTDIWGPDYYQQTRGNFFPNETVFGGMWDALHRQNGKPVGVVEIKTTSRPEDWQNGAPIHYALQACLYAYLLGVETVTIGTSFLSPSDYEDPSAFIPSADNTIIDQFPLYGRFPQFDKLIEAAVNWWQDHVLTGKSPPYNEKTDKDILAALRTNSIETEGWEMILRRAESLKAKLDAVKETEKEYKGVLDQLKAHCIANLRDGDTRVELQGEANTFTLLKSTTTSIDKNALKKDGLLEKYSVENDSYRFSVKEKK
jgi:hypothetical protein